MKRIYFIDWLRILAIITVFFFHSSHFFDPIYWHVKNNDQSQTVLVFLGFVNIWIMPLFFFLSGSAVYFGLGKPFGSYAMGKVKRLLVPLIFGILFLIPPQKYVEALANHKFAGGYIDFLKGYFGGWMFDYRMGFNVAWIGAISYHLWFLGHLFILSLLFYPLPGLLKRHEDSIRRFTLRLTNFRGGVLLLFLPVAVVRVLLKRHFPEYTGWSDLAAYSFFFLYGYMFIRWEELRNIFARSFSLSLVTGTVLFVSYIASFSFRGSFLSELFRNNRITGFYIFQESASALATWAWLIVIITAGMKYLNFESERRPVLNEAVLPFYILHQTVLLLVGFIVVQWNWNAWLKFGFISLSTLFLIMVIYLFVVKPYNPVRLLFGMRTGDGNR